jgi:intracellular septation protein A
LLILRSARYVRKNVISLLVASGGILTAYIGLFTPANIYFLNYRQMRIPEWFYLVSIIGLALYLLGISAVAIVLQLMPSQRSEVEPSFLVLGGIIGLLFGSLPLYITSNSPFVILPVSLLLSLFGVRLACSLPGLKSNSHRVVRLLRNLIPSLFILLTLTVIWVHNSSFPGVTAPSTVRQQWADKEFGEYKEVMETIKTCQPIIERVGSVKYVAPTQGRNYVIDDSGSSGHRGEFTLEVVGEKGIGVANFNFHHFTAVSHGQLTYQDRKEEIVCRG